MCKHSFVLLALVAGCGLAQAQAIGTEAWYAVTDARGVQSINIECREGFFDPPEIVVKSNVPVELLVRTPEPSHEFLSDFTPGRAIGRQPSAHQFTPRAHGHFSVSCQKQGEAEEPGARARKRGRLIVVPDNSR
jgi:hypothetical protein